MNLIERGILPADALTEGDYVELGGHIFKIHSITRLSGQYVILDMFTPQDDLLFASVTVMKIQPLKFYQDQS